MEHRPFADRWEFVDYVRQQKLGLDLTAPPAPGCCRKKWRAERAK